MAIVAVDVVGYSRLMADDEDATLAALRELRGLIDPIFEAGGGRIVKSTGDGILVEAPSVIDATRAALAAQKSVGNWNARRQGSEPMLIRIGVNLGDVVVDGTGDIYGDGVNVAARLEGLADPGGICISEAAHHQLRGRIDVPMTDRGEQRVKNIPRPIRVWSIDPDGAPAAGRNRRRVLIPAAVILTIALIAGGSVALSRGGDATADPTTTTTTDPGDGLLAIESAAWVAGFDDPIDLIATDGGTVVLSLATGEIHALQVDGGAAAWPAIVPAGGDVTSLDVAGGVAVYGVHGSRVIHALEISNGAEAWRVLLELEGVDIAPRISIAGDSVFVAVGFGAERLAIGTGTSNWARQLVGNLSIDALSAGRTVVGIGDGRFVHGIDPADGTTSWQVGPPQVSGGVTWIQAWVVEVEGGFSSTFEGRVLVVTGDLDLVVIDGRTGSVEWTRPVSGTPAVSDDLVFVAGVDGELVTFEAEGGADAWSRPDVTPTWPPVVFGDSLLVVAGSDLLVLNPRSGSTRASIDLGAEPTGPAVPVGGVVVLPFGSTLAAFSVEGR